MAGPAGVRYSQDKKDIGSAKSFSWEYPVPVNQFWNDLHYTVGRNFLQNFSAKEIEQFPIDPDSTLDKKAKLELLIKLLQGKLASEDVAAAPETFYDINYPAWENLWLGIYTVQQELGHRNAEQTIHMLVDRRKDKSNLSHLHSLSGFLLSQGRYAEAEDTEKPVKVWLDENLGKDSPQALGSRRMIAQSIWKQGPSRRTEANQLLYEVKEIISGMGSGRFAVYQEEEKQLTETLICDLEKEDTAK